MSCKTFADQAFAFAGPPQRKKLSQENIDQLIFAWLPMLIRTAPNLVTFQKQFKTCLFKKKIYDIRSHHIL